MSDEAENYPYQGIPDDVRAHVEHFDIDQVRDLDAEQLQVQLDAAKQRKAEADDDVEKYRAAIVDIKTLRLIMAEKEIDEVPELNPSNRTVAATPGEKSLFRKISGASCRNFLIKCGHAANTLRYLQNNFQEVLS